MVKDMTLFACDIAEKLIVTSSISYISYVYILLKYMYVHVHNAGGLAIGVPGEVRGFYEAWKMFGRVEWASLFEPTIQLMENGYKIEKVVEEKVAYYEDLIRKDVNFRFVNVILFVPHT